MMEQIFGHETVSESFQVLYILLAKPIQRHKIFAFPEDYLAVVTLIAKCALFANNLNQSKAVRPGYRAHMPPKLGVEIDHNQRSRVVGIHQKRYFIVVLSLVLRYLTGYDSPSMDLPSITFTVK